MKININAVHFKADKKLETFITDKVSKLASSYEGVISSDVTLKLENSVSTDNKIAEIRMIIPGSDLFAKKQCKSFEEAADLAVDALKKQLDKHKDKTKK